MADDRPHDLFRLGFLTAVRIGEEGAGGHVGGLLVTNRHGRPLEFQCTTPVRPNRTQEILYGPTLVPFVLGELIGRTLVERVGVKPDLLLVDQPEFLELRPHVAMPVGCVELNEQRSPVERESSDATDGNQRTADDGRPTASESAAAEECAVPAAPPALGRQRIRFHAAHSDDLRALRAASPNVPADADLLEPFERVREALRETLRER